LAPFVATLGPASTPRAVYRFDPGPSTKAALHAMRACGLEVGLGRLTLSSHEIAVMRSELVVDSIRDVIAA